MNTIDYRCALPSDHSGPHQAGAGRGEPVEYFWAKIHSLPDVDWQRTGSPSRDVSPRLTHVYERFTVVSTNTPERHTHDHDELTDLGGPPIAVSSSRAHTSRTALLPGTTTAPAVAANASFPHHLRTAHGPSDGRQ